MQKIKTKLQVNPETFMSKILDNFFSMEYKEFNDFLRERKSLNEGLYGLFAYVYYGVIPLFSNLPAVKQLYYLISETLIGL